MSSEYGRRPDPSEPWRYACPNCGSFILEQRLSGLVICEECYSGHDFEDLVDRKEGRDR